MAEILNKKNQEIKEVREIFDFIYTYHDYKVYGCCVIDCSNNAGYFAMCESHHAFLCEKHFQEFQNEKEKRSAAFKSDTNRLTNSASQETSNKNKKDRRNYVYLLIDKINGCYKIGRAFDPRFREGTLQSEKPFIELVYAWEAEPAEEQLLHRMFKKKRIRGEWFSLDEDDIELIKNYFSEHKSFKEDYGS